MKKLPWCDAFMLVGAMGMIATNRADDSLYAIAEAAVMWLLALLVTAIVLGREKE